MSRTEKSLRRDWGWGKAFSIDKYYVPVELYRKINEALETKTVTLTSIHDLMQWINSINTGDEKSEDGSSSVNKVLILGRNVSLLGNHFRLRPCLNFNKVLAPSSVLRSSGLEPNSQKAERVQ